MPTINKNKQISGGSLYSTDSDHILTTADQIYDEQKGCYVSEYDFSGNIKSVNNQFPDQNGNIKLPIYYFYKNSGETVYRCLDGLTDADLTTQELQNLYSQIINYAPNEVNNTYFFNSRIPLTVRVVGRDTVQFIGANQDLYRENALNYIQINLNASGEITGNEITLPYIKSLQISNNNLVVETNTTTENLPLPVVQANWAQQDSNKSDFIQNKPLQYYIILGDNNTEWTVATYPPVDNPFQRLKMDLNTYVDSNNLNLNLQRINIGDGTGRMVHPITYTYYQSTYYFSLITGDNSVPSENLYYLKIKCNNQGIFQYVENTRLNLEAGNNVEINNGRINVDLNSTEIKSNKVEAITEENKESTTNYPSVKALVNYIDKDKTEAVLEATDLSTFLAAAKIISENTSSTQRYRLKIKGVIDFSNPSAEDKAATIKWQRNNNYGVYNEAERCWNFEGIFMYTIIQGDSSNTTLKTTYIENGAINTVSLKLFNAVFENIIIGGSPLTGPSTIYHNWSRPLFIGTNNVYFKFTNCTFTILGHNSIDYPNNCKLIKAISDNNTHQGANKFQFYHTNIIFTTCTWNSGRNVWDNNENKMSGGNLTNAEITLDFSEDNIDAYKRNDLTRSLQIISNIKQIRFSDNDDNIEKDLPEIGIPRFHINCYNNEKWSVISDAHALITSNKPANINYYATVTINDVFFTNPIYVKTGDDTFNTSYTLKTYIQDLENRIKTLETRLNTN